MKRLIIAALAVVVSAGCREAPEPSARSSEVSRRAEPTAPEPAAEGDGADLKPAASLPRLVDLGASKCIPCKMMAPILEELDREYEGVFDVQFIDVWENRGAAVEYGIEMIPTQIFFDASGKELFRHEGFFGKEDILGKWRELGIDIDVKGT